VLRWGIPLAAYMDYAEEKQMPKSRGIFLLGKEMDRATSA